MRMRRAHEIAQLARVPYRPTRIIRKRPVPVHVKAEVRDRREQVEVPARIAERWIAKAAAEREAEDFLAQSRSPATHASEMRPGRITLQAGNGGGGDAIRFSPHDLRPHTLMG